MRHNRRTHRLSRNHSERKAMLENIVSSLLVHQEIQTTLPKAKEAKRLADRVICLGKEDSLAARRHVFSCLQDHELTAKVFKEVAPRFKNRNGGYTRILRLGQRRGDGAPMALLELTEKEIHVKETAKEKPKKEKHEPKRPKEHGPKPPQAEKETPKRPEARKEKPKWRFFQNISRFFRNKGGG